MSGTTTAPGAAQATASGARRRGLGRDFTLLLSAYSFQTLGEGVLIAALPLLASRLTDNPRLISWVGLAQELPWLLLALPGGVIVDRYNRRRLMLGAQAGQAGMLVVVAVLASMHLAWIWLLYLMAFTLGTGDVLFSGANRAAIPALVAKEDLESANGRNVTAETLGRQFVGPPLGSALFAFALPLPFWLNAATYLASLLLISRIRGGGARFRTAPAPSAAPSAPTAVQGPAVPAPATAAAPAVPAPASPAERRRLLHEALEGLRFLLTHRVLRAVTVLAAISNFSLFMVQSVLVLYAKHVLHVGNTGYGVLVASMGIGGVVGGLFAKRIVKRFGARTVAVYTALSSASTLLTIGVVGHRPVVVVALFLIRSTNMSLWNVMAQSLSQRLVPGELRGRTVTGARMIAYGALPLGALAGGLVSGDWGLQAPWIVGGTVHLTAALLFLPALLRWPAFTQDGAGGR
jgi:predicted MFS family arabinose efflux permease